MILVCLVTHDRLMYSARTLSSLNDRAELVIVDSASQDPEMHEWLDVMERDRLVIRLSRNVFPGAACNIGWYEGLKHWPQADLLMRSDNDIEYLPGWHDHVGQAFTYERLGQLGVLNRHEDYDNNQPVKEEHGVNTHFGQVGGNSVIRRSLYDQGLRWTPGTWRPGGMDEDAIMSAKVTQRGFVVGELIPTVANNMSYGRFSDYEDYYRFTAGLRGLVPELSV